MSLLRTCLSQSHSGDVLFTFHQDPMSWGDAEAVCREAGGHLASICSVSEVEQLRATAGIENANVWIGLTDEDDEGHFTWSDGSNCDYRNWHAGGSEPNGGTGENCVNVWGEGSGRDANSWNDLSCQSELPFVCANSDFQCDMTELFPIALSCASNNPDDPTFCVSDCFLQLRPFLSSCADSLPDYMRNLIEVTQQQFAICDDDGRGDGSETAQSECAMQCYSIFGAGTPNACACMYGCQTANDGADLAECIRTCDTECDDADECVCGCGNGGTCCSSGVGCCDSGDECENPCDAGCNLLFDTNSDPSATAYTLLHSDSECNSADVGLGHFENVDECADACYSYNGCNFFIYGKAGAQGDKTGRCYAEFTQSDTCPEGWESDSYDFYGFTTPAADVCDGVVADLQSLCLTASGDPTAATPEERAAWCHNGCVDAAVNCIDDPALADYRDFILQVAEGDCASAEIDCASIVSDISSVFSEACCASDAAMCAAGVPSSCSSTCAQVFVPFMQQCGQELQESWSESPDQFGLYEDFLATCSGAGSDNTPTFSFQQQSTTWGDAHSGCLAMGGELASIHSDEENVIAQSLIGGMEAWIGMTDQAVEGQFVWTDSSSAAYTNWAGGEPNDWGGGEDASVLRGSTGFWNDLASDSTADGYLCRLDSAMSAASFSPQPCAGIQLGQGEEVCPSLTWGSSIVMHDNICSVVANTAQSTCDQWCQSQGRQCLQAHDNSGSGCLLSADNSPLPNNGCSTNLNNQVCGCSGATGQIVSGTAMVNARSDGAEESAADGSMYISSSDYELMFDGGEQIVGIVFPSVNIPAGSQVLSAEVYFNVDEVRDLSAQPVSISIHGEANANAAPPSLVQYDISSRTTTSASVEWNPGTSLEVHEDLISPDISAILNEIVSLPEWHQGNSVALIFTLLSGTGSRWVESLQTGVAGVRTPAIRFQYATGLADNSGH